MEKHSSEYLFTGLQISGILSVSSLLVSAFTDAETHAIAPIIGAPKV